MGSIWREIPGGRGEVDGGGLGEGASHWREQGPNIAVVGVVWCDAVLVVERGSRQVELL